MKSLKQAKYREHKHLRKDCLSQANVEFRYNIMDFKTDISNTNF